MKFLLVILLCSSFSSYGRDAKDDTVVINKLIGEFKDTILEAPARAAVIAQQVYDLSEKADYKIGMAKGMLELAEANSRTGQQEKAIECLQTALKISRENHLRNIEAKVLSGLAAISAAKNNSAASMSYLADALDIYKSLNDSNGIALTYMNIGVIFMDHDNYGEALKNYNEAMSLYSALNNLHQVANLHFNVGQLYFRQEAFDKGMGHIHAAIDLALQVNDVYCLSQSYNALANYFAAKNKPDSAVWYYSNANMLAQKIGDQMQQAVALFNIGQIKEESGQFVSAADNYLRALGLAKEISYLRLITEIDHRLALVYGGMHNYRSAFEFYDSAYAILDSFRNEEKEKALAEMNAKYNTKELENKNELLKKERDIKQAKLKQENILMYSAFGCAVLFLIIGILLVRQSRLRAERQRLELEQKQLLAQINPHFIFNCLNSIQQFVVQNDTANANRYLADFALLMRQTLDNSKDGLIPVSREIEYLENYLSFEHMRFEDKFSYSVTCARDVNANNTEIPSMIIQPFVENAIRHGLCNLETRKGVLKISFYKKDGILFCEVDDNGIGMEESQKLKEQAFIKYQSHGMELTKQRLALVSKMHSEDYKISIINKRDKDDRSAGTTIIIKFPLQV